MPNPPVILCDADATCQVFIARQPVLFQILQDDYGIRPVLVEEVELEIVSNPKARIKSILSDFKKALTKGTISVLTEAEFKKLPGLPRNTSWTEIQSEGNRYKVYNGIHLGEAYTHAAASCMGVPSMSHDKEAIDTMVEKGLGIPSPILRTFDLVCLAYQVSKLGLPQCETIRSELEMRTEWVPRPFQRTSFEAGLPGFCPRIQCASRPPLGKGSATPPGYIGHGVQIRIEPRSLPPAPATVGTKTT